MRRTRQRLKPEAGGNDGPATSEGQILRSYANYGAVAASGDADMPAFAEPTKSYLSARRGENGEGNGGGTDEPSRSPAQVFATKVQHALAGGGVP